MFKKFFRKAFLIGGVFLLSTFMVVQSSWGCDDKDKWDCDHHDKWDCDKHGKPCRPPKIQAVFLQYPDDSIVFEIWGENFYQGGFPVVTLGGTIELAVDEAYTDDSVIIATLSSIKEKNFAFGDYRLVVSTCRDSVCKDKYCRDHGPNCKCTYCKKHCSKCKEKYCKDDERKCRCKDRYSLTIAGPPVPPGPPGTIGWEIQSAQGSLVIGTDQISGIALCSPGFKVTGGGFFSSTVIIRASTPFQNPKNPDETGWQVIGTREKEYPEPELTIYAICVQSQQLP